MPDAPAQTPPVQCDHVQSTAPDSRVSDAHTVDGLDLFDDGHSHHWFCHKSSMRGWRFVLPSEECRANAAA
jgi:hypothetical protein